MICPACAAEYREGITVCADCEVLLVGSLDEAPARSAADDALAPVSFPVAPGLAALHETGDSDELAMLVELLERSQVPYLVEAGTALSLLDGTDAGSVVTPDLWRARVAVAERQLPRARDLLAVARSGGAAQGEPLE